MTQPRDIESRLSNWSRWCQVHRQPAISITGLICDRMRRSVLGNVWSGHDVRDPVDEADALLLEAAVCDLPPIDKRLIKAKYVDGARWQVGCRVAQIRVSQELHQMLLAHAVRRLEGILTDTEAV